MAFERAASQHETMQKYRNYGQKKTEKIQNRWAKAPETVFQNKRKEIILKAALNCRNFKAFLRPKPRPKPTVIYLYYCFFSAF